MEYRRLGNSGLRVSRIALGCMSFGDTSRGFSEWSLGYEDAQPFFQQAVELGVTFWDTANVYGFGSSEEIVGRALKKYSRREDIVLATKVHFTMHDGPGGSGLSRKAIMEQIDASLANSESLGHGANFGDEQARLFPGAEVTASSGLTPVDDRRESGFSPSTEGVRQLLWEDGASGGYGDAVATGCGEPAGHLLDALPVQPS